MGGFVAAIPEWMRVLPGGGMGGEGRGDDPLWRIGARSLTGRAGGERTAAELVVGRGVGSSRS